MQAYLKVVSCTWSSRAQTSIKAPTFFKRGPMRQNSYADHKKTPPKTQALAIHRVPLRLSGRSPKNAFGQQEKRSPAAKIEIEKRRNERTADDAAPGSFVGFQNSASEERIARRFESAGVMVAVSAFEWTRGRVCRGEAGFHSIGHRPVRRRLNRDP